MSYPSRSDIAAVCEETNQPGAELQCLQENYKMLSTDCQQSVKEYSMAEAKNTRYDRDFLVNGHSVNIKQVFWSLMDLM